MSILSEDLSVSLGNLQEHGMYSGKVRRNIDWSIITRLLRYNRDCDRKDDHCSKRYLIERLMEMALRYIDIEDLAPDVLLHKVDSVAHFDAVTLDESGGFGRVRITFWTKKSHGSHYAWHFFVDIYNLDDSVREWIKHVWAQASMFKYKECFGDGCYKYCFIRNR